MKGLLSGIRVLDLTRMLAGPYGTMLLADMGAEVIKIEDQDGDFTRVTSQITHDGVSAYFLAVNRNKRSIVLDLKHPDGKALFYEMVKLSDVVVDNMRPQALRRLACDFDDIKKFNPKIISCSISGFGHTGPYRDRPAFDLTIQAWSGGMGLTGEKGGAPVRMGIPLADLAGGFFGALAIVSALHHRNKTGKGQKLDISLLDCQISLTSYLAAYYFIGGMIAGPQGSRHESVVPYEAFKTKDIWVVVACVTPKFWEGLCRVLELEQLISDERFDDMTKRVINHDELFPILQEAFLQKTADEWLRKLDQEGVPGAPVNTIDRALNDPQVLERNMVVEINHPRGKFKLAGNPIKTPGLEEEVFSPPPDLGEHTEEILRDLLGFSDEKIEALKAQKVVGRKEDDNGN
jgi:CoA:oxalate CoA-transferase